MTDYFNYRLQKYNRGSSFGSTLVGITGSNGTTLYQLGGPRYMTPDPSEEFMYIADADNHRIMRISTSTTSISNVTIVAGGNGCGSAMSQLCYPWSVDYKPSVSPFLYITNAWSNTVMKWAPGAPNGTIVAGVHGGCGANATLLCSPMDVKIDHYQNIYVMDGHGHRVQMFCENSTTGITIAGMGTTGNGSKELHYARSIEFDSVMNLYVGGLFNKRTQNFLKLRHYILSL